MIELFLHLLLRKGKRNASPSAVERHRHVTADPVVLECPRCGAMGVSGHVIVEEAVGASENWRAVNDIYTCGSCGAVYEREHLESDTQGVVRVKTWSCASCGRANDATRFTCADCGAWPKQA